MKITKKALNENLQKNVTVDEAAYTAKGLAYFLENGNITGLFGDYVIGLQNVDKLDIVFECGYLRTVAVLKTGERIFITL